MIDPGLFTAGFATLCAAFGREQDEAVGAAYYRVLAPELADGEWEQVVAETMRTERYWPSPAVLLSKRRDVRAARAALRALRSAVDRSGGFRYFPADAWASLDAPTRAGIAAAGGLRELTLMEHGRPADLEQRFIEAYDDAARAARRQALAPSARRAAALTALGAGGPA